MTEPEANSGCRLWTGSVCARGYGRVAYRGYANAVLVHRIAFERAYGPIGSKHVLHRCDTPSCVNPDHLFLGTQKDNMRDMFAKGRARPHGIGRAATQVLRSVASRKSSNTVKDVGILHHMRTDAMTAPWCRVVGGPGASDWSEIPEGQRPLWRTVVDGRTGEPVTDGLDGGAVLHARSGSSERAGR